MKNFLCILVLMLLSVSSVKAAVLDFASAEAQNATKPMAVLIYANWADGYENSLNQFRKVQSELGNIYNFVELDIASKDAKLYNDSYVIYTKLPYIMLFRTKGRFSMLIDRACTQSADCAMSKMKIFKR